MAFTLGIDTRSVISQHRKNRVADMPANIEANLKVEKVIKVYSTKIYYFTNYIIFKKNKQLYADFESQLLI